MKQVERLGFSSSHEEEAYKVGKKEVAANIKAILVDKQVGAVLSAKEQAILDRIAEIEK